MDATTAPPVLSAPTALSPHAPSFYPVTSPFSRAVTAVNIENAQSLSANRGRATHSLGRTFDPLIPRNAPAPPPLYLAERSPPPYGGRTPTPTPAARLAYEVAEAVLLDEGDTIPPDNDGSAASDSGSATPTQHDNQRLVTPVVDTSNLATPRQIVTRVAGCPGRGPTIPELHARLRAALGVSGPVDTRGNTETSRAQPVAEGNSSDHIPPRQKRTRPLPRVVFVIARKSHCPCIVIR